MNESLRLNASDQSEYHFALGFSSWAWSDESAAYSPAQIIRRLKIAEYSFDSSPAAEYFIDLFVNSV